MNSMLFALLAQANLLIQAIDGGHSKPPSNDFILTWKRKGPLGDVDATHSGDSCGIYKTDGIGTIDDHGRKVYFASDNTVWRSKNRGIKFGRNSELIVLPDKYDTFEYVGLTRDYLSSKTLTKRRRDKDKVNETPSVEGVEFENIFGLPAYVRSPENYGFLVHYSPDGKKWRTKDGVFMMQVMSRQFEHLVGDGGYTEYTSADGQMHWDEVGNPDDINLKTGVWKCSAKPAPKFSGKQLKKQRSKQDQSEHRKEDKNIHVPTE